MTRAIHSAAAALAAAVFLSACGTEVSTGEITDGQTLNYSVFEAQVNQIFDKDIGGRTCSDSGCHLQPIGPGGAFKIFKNAAPGSAEMLANFISAKGFANLTDPASSKLLLEPLAGAQSITGSHTGGDIFPDTTDTDYQTIFQWISTPEPIP
jgi:hypothetical protein